MRPEAADGWLYFQSVCIVVSLGISGQLIIMIGLRTTSHSGHESNKFVRGDWADYVIWCLSPVLVDFEVGEFWVSGLIVFSLIGHYR